MLTKNSISKPFNFVVPSKKINNASLIPIPAGTPTKNKPIHKER